MIEISVIIPVKSLNNLLTREVFPAFSKQKFTNFELIVVPDKHLQQESFSWLRIIDFVGSPSEKRNYAASHSRGRILAFLDDDAIPSQNWLLKIHELFDCVENESKKQIVAFCGPGILPKNSSFFEDIFDLVLCSKINSGNLTYRFQIEKQKNVDDYPLMNFSIIKQVFLKLGGLVDHWPGEDTKLCQKIIDLKMQIVYSPEMLVYHHRKNNIFNFVRQHMRYGFKRGLFFADGDQNSRKIIYTIPALFVCYLIICGFIINFLSFELRLLIFLPIGFYIVLLVFSIFSIKRDVSLLKKILSRFVIVLILFLYGLNFIRGYIFAFLLKSTRKRM